MYKLYIFTMNQFILTKKIAKHGSQSIIIVPRALESHLKPKTLVKLTIDIIEDPEVAQ